MKIRKTNVPLNSMMNEWKKTKIKYIGEIRGRIGFRGYTVEDTVDPDTLGAAVVLGGTNVMKDGTTNYAELTYLSEEKYLESPEIMLHGGEILITKVGAGTGENSIYDGRFERATTNPNVMILLPKENVSSIFINYLLLSDHIKEDMRVESTKSGAQPAINQGYINNLNIFIPPYDTQRAIADYLDAQCAKIDGIVADLENQIDLLLKYKKSLITETVTKGLNKSVPMKDSGIEWIGRIPEHWNINRVRYLTKLCSGSTPSKDIYAYWEGNIPWVSSQEVKSDVINDTSLHISEDAIRSCSTQLMPKGTMVMVVRSGILQHTIPVALLGVPATINQDIKAFTFGKDMIPPYFKYFIQGLNDELLSVLIKDKTTVESIDNNLLLSMKVMVPPTLEQKNIVDFLDKKCGHINAILEDKQQQLLVLFQHKKSLIYEYVTGKKRVKEVC